MPEWLVLGKRPSVPKNPTVGIQRGGKNFSLSRSALESLGNPKAVEVLYDSANRLVGFRRGDGSPNAYKVGRTGVIAAKALVRVLDFGEQPLGRYEAKMIDGVLTIDLKRGPVSASA